MTLSQITIINSGVYIIYIFKNTFLIRVYQYVWHGVARIQEQRPTALLSQGVGGWGSKLCELM